MLDQKVEAKPGSKTGTVKLLSGDIYRTREKARLRFFHTPGRDLPAGSRLWMLFDIRQGAGAPQDSDPAAANHVSAASDGKAVVTCKAYSARTLDLYPQVVEFLHVCEFTFEEGWNGDDALKINLGSDENGWELPIHPIEVFRFWFVSSEPEGWSFEPTGFKSYREFRDRKGSGALPSKVEEIAITVVGGYPAPQAADTRRTPGILWGDLHGMAFNQRPLDDYYRYARDIAGYDFAAAMLFSYNICVEGIWDKVREAATRWTEPGKFIAVTGVEAGTVPDGSHRNAHFFRHPEKVPPIFCEDRPPALDPRLHRRFSPHTVICNTLEEYYETVSKYGAIVSGHWHTLTYHKETLAEIWQKQTGSLTEETRIFELLNQGCRLGIISGCDTHDSMPGNPAPEPGCPQPSGQTGVFADEITAEAIEEALLARRVYATTGARIALRVEANGEPMGSILSLSGSRSFEVRIEGSGKLSHVELIRNGTVVSWTRCNGTTFDGEIRDATANAGDKHWYVVKVIQMNGHRAWSSPIWFE